MILRRIAAPSIAALALTFTVAACGSAQSTPNNTPATQQSGVLNAADITFAQGMIAHHQQAIEMADIALDPASGAGAEVIDLATRIKGAQGPEVATMTDWLTKAGEPVVADVGGGQAMSTMDGMMTKDQMDAMAAMTGPEFDKVWLGMMISHHEGAISQSQAVKKNGSNADVLTLADDIISAQQAQITEMKALLKS